MMRSIAGLAVLLSAGLLLCGLLLFGEMSVRRQGDRLQHKQLLVQILGLTDLSLSSEARYTRHPSQADLFSAFQDFPAAIEHFPTGSMIPPRPVGFGGRVRVVPSVQEPR